MNYRDQWFRKADSVSRPYVLNSLAARWPALPSDDIEEAYQDAIIQLARNSPDGGPEAALGGVRYWLFKVTENLLRNGHRKQKRRGVVIPLNAPASKEGEFARDMEWELGGVENDNKILFEQRYDWVLALLQDFTPQQRGLIIGFYIEGRSMDELAEQLGYSDRNSAKVAKCKVLKRLQEAARRYSIYLDQAA